MKYDQFRSEVSAYPVIDTGMLKLKYDYKQSLKVQLKRWHKSGEIVRVRKNLYLLKAEDRKINPSRLFLASKIYSPSYVSMEFALSFYGIIPEKVTDITAITTKKTAIFRTPLGVFSYKHVKPYCFNGFIERKDESGLPFFIALAEKAIIDFLYLNLSRFQEDYEKVLQESFRVQNIGMLKKTRLEKFAKLFNNKKLMKVVRSLIVLQKDNL